MIPILAVGIIQKLDSCPPQTSGANILQSEYHVHRKKLLLLNSSLQIPEHGGILNITIVSHVVMDELVAWLYSPRRNLQLLGLECLPLLGIYKFGSDYDIEDLVADCYLAMSRHHAVFHGLEEIFDTSSSSIKTLILQAVDGLCGNQAFNLFEGYGSAQQVIDIYMIGLKLNKRPLCNMAMDKLRDIMASEESVLSVQQVSDIFSQANHYKLESIRLFCAGLVLFQSICEECPESQRLDAVTEAEFHDISEFSTWFDKYETTFKDSVDDGNEDEDAEPEWDPRVPSGCDKCYFHDHSDDEECHAPDDDEEDEVPPPRVPSASPEPATS